MTSKNIDFLELLSSSELISINFNVEYYRKEQEKYRKLSSKARIIMSKYVKVDLLQELARTLKNIERMESNLAAGIITGIIPMSKIAKLGFTSKEIKPILEKYEKEIKQEQEDVNGTLDLRNFVYNIK